jgi:hypothetical protein
MLFEPAPWYLSIAWLNPAILASLGVLFLTVLSWPVVALVRRYYGVVPPRGIQPWRAYRLSRAFAGLVLVVLACWFRFASALLGDFSSMNGELDWALGALQVATPLVLLAALGLAVWNAVLVWKTKGRRFEKGWSLLLTLSVLVILWMAKGFHLIGVGFDF